MLCAMAVPDIDKYRRHVEGFDLSDDQKAELIHTVWAIMESFVDRAFGIDSVQQSGRLSLGKDAAAESAVVESDKTVTTLCSLSDTFQRHAGTGRGRKT